MSESTIKLAGWCLVLLLAPPTLLVAAKSREWFPKDIAPAERGGKILFFTSDRCGACRAVKKTVAQLQGEGLPIRTVNIQQQPKLARKYGIYGIPCFVYVVDGEERDRLTGAYPAKDIRALMQ